ncbi:hypothetical protein DL98DRAFT_594245 [Cadophora sp. DSE1049]|nr:hypothetical protein DL98DRAFT_594245 [Cadophora sp. DSE1049]
MDDNIPEYEVRELHNQRYRQKMKQLFRQVNPSGLWKSDRAKCLAACLVHLPSLITTTALIYLNFSSKWFSDADTPNQNAQLNALQFAAKIHEIVILASLSTVAVSCVQHELCRREGLAIGGVLAAFQISNILSLFSPALWKTRATTGSASRRILFGLLITLLTLLGAIVGPSSAILMLPSVGLWDLNIPLTWFQGGNQEVNIFLAGNESTIWPTSITTSNFLPPECIVLNASKILPSYCPAAGLPILLTNPLQGSLYLENNLYPESAYTPTTDAEYRQTWNFSMPENGTVSSSIYQYSRGVQGVLKLIDNSTMLTQSTAASVNNAMISIFAKARLSRSERDTSQWKANVAWRFSLKNGNRTLAPQTFVICQTEPLLLDPSTKSVVAGQRLTFPLRGQKHWSMDATMLTEPWNSTTKILSRWIQPPELFNITPSISFALVGDLDREVVYLNKTSPTSYSILAPEIVTCSQQPESTEARGHSPVLDVELRQIEIRQRELKIISALNDNNGESDGNLPSLEERTALRPEISTEASKTGGPPSSAWNSQLFTVLDCKSTEHN